MYSSIFDLSVESCATTVGLQGSLIVRFRLGVVCLDEKLDQRLGSFLVYLCCDPQLGQLAHAGLHIRDVW